MSKQFMSKIMTYARQHAEKSRFMWPAFGDAGFQLSMLRHSIAVLAMISLISACGHGGRPPGTGATAPSVSSDVTDRERALRRSLPGDPRTLDPQLADDEYSFQVVRDLYEGLTAEDAHGKIVPGIARSWTVNKAGTVYTFDLRKGARWSDGTDVTAEQFVNGLRRAVDPRTASGSAELLLPIAGAKEIMAGSIAPSGLGVSAIGESIVQVKLTSPAPYILQILSQPISAPLRSYIPGNLTTTDPKITDGPYSLVGRTIGTDLELRANPYYWNSHAVRIRRVQYLISESEATEINEFRANQIDMTYTIPISEVPELERNMPAEVQIEPILATFFMAVNMTHSPLGSNRELRQALSMSVDRRQIVEAILPGAMPAFSLVPPQIENYTPPIYEWSKWTDQKILSRAQSLLEKNGYTPNHPLKLSVYFNNDETIKKVILAVVQNWKETLGVQVTLHSDEFRVFLERRRDKSLWDIARYGWNADYDDASSFLDVFTDGSPQNDEDYKNPMFNSLVRSAELEANTSRRRQLLENAESVLLNDYVVIPIYFYESRRLVKSDVGGAYITPLNHSYSKFLYWRRPN